MSPILQFILAEIVRQAPTLAIDIVQILSKPAPTDADWAALRAKYGGQTYDQYVPPKTQ